VRTRFVDAAERFAPQKGATPSQVRLLRGRLERLADVYRHDHGVDVTELVGSGAAGGLAGGLAAAGARLESGFDVVADELELFDRLEHADLVITGEGFIDAESFDGKVVGGVARMAVELDIPVLAVAGRCFDGTDSLIDAVSLVDRFGEARAMGEPLACIEALIAERLA
jgi:glycerate kinase